MPAILFTAFEPSGDQLAAPVIARLRQVQPKLDIFALGGPKMKAAGATLLEETGRHAVMLGGAFGQIKAHRQRVERMRRWLSEHAIDALVPVDSPAANWAMCKLTRALHPQAKIIHLAAPQIWAWARWRIRKLRRLTDHVLCLLPFEPKWFGDRGVPCTFVGHPLFHLAKPAAAARNAQDGIGSVASQADGAEAAPPTGLPDSHPRLALLPGSRRSEIDANWPTMFAAFEQLAHRHPTLQGCVAAADQTMAERIAEVSRRTSNIQISDLKSQISNPESPIQNPKSEIPNPKSEIALAPALSMRVGDVDAILDWADAVLVVSGTATLHTAVHRKPMVILYNLARWKWHLIGRFLVTTRTFTLPNLIAEAAGRGRIVPEFVPHFGKVEPVVAATDTLLADAAARAPQIDSLRWLAEQFEGVDFVERASGRILSMLASGGGR